MSTRLRVRRSNAILWLYDSPWYRDWLAVLTLLWLAFSVLGFVASVATPTSDPNHNSLPAAAAVFLFLMACVLIVAIVRRGVRSSRRKTRAYSEVSPATRIDKTRAPPPVSEETAQSDVEQSAQTASEGNLAPPSSGPAAVPNLNATESPPPDEVDSDASPPVPESLSAQEPTSPPGVSLYTEMPETALGSSGHWSASSSKIFAEAQQSMPYPLARMVRKLIQAHDPEKQREQFVDAQRILAVALGSLAMAWCREQGRISSQMDAFLEAIFDRGVTEGMWLSAAQAAGKTPHSDGFMIPGMTEALSPAKGGNQLINDAMSLAQWRTSWAHGRDPVTPLELAEWVADFGQLYERVLAAAQFLAAADWVIVDNCAWQKRQKRFLVQAQRAMGAHPDFDTITFFSATPVAEDCVYVLTKSGPIDLTPFIVVRDCPTCQQTEVLYANVVHPSTGVMLTSFATHHVINDQSLVADLEEIRHPSDDATPSTA